MFGLESVLGAIGSGLTTAVGVDMAKKQMMYQGHMSSTSYQRGMADMKAAGLNPMLAYSQGGASTVSGASYSPPDFGNVVATAAQASKVKADEALSRKSLDKLDKEIENLDITGANTQSQTELNTVNADLARAAKLKMQMDTLTSMNTAKNVGLQNDILKFNQMINKAKTQSLDAIFERFGKDAVGTGGLLGDIFNKVAPIFKSSRNKFSK